MHLFTCSAVSDVPLLGCLLFVIPGARRLTAADDAVERDAAAKAFCEEYHLTERRTPVRFYDLFMFNDELDMLEV